MNILNSTHGTHSHAPALLARVISTYEVCASAWMRLGLGLVGEDAGIAEVKKERSILTAPFWIKALSVLTVFYLSSF